MKPLLQKETAPGTGVVREPAKLNVCMHVRGTLRTDGRVKREASALLQEGFSVTVIDVERERSVSQTEILDGISVKHLLKPHWFIPARGVWRIIKSMEKFFSCTLAILSTAADVYHAHDVNALPACYLAAKVHRKPLVFDAHELPLYEFDHSRQQWLRKLLHRLLTMILRNSVSVITVSPPIAQEIRTRYHRAEVSLVRNVPAYQAVKKNNRLCQYLHLEPTTRIALYQGNLQPDRGLDGLIRAAKFLMPDTAIVLMGKAVGNAQAQLETLICQEGVANRVKIIPAVPYEELLEWTASADIGLIIYTPELSLNIQMCLPNKLFEYLMAGLPVLATPLDAVAEILETYQAGQIVSSLAPEEVAAAINAMLGEPAQLERMHCNALAAAKKELHWEKECSQLLTIYQRISTNR